MQMQLKLLMSIQYIRDGCMVVKQAYLSSNKQESITITSPFALL